MGIAFSTPVDICNRAMQLIGAPRIDPTLGFTEDSKSASECSFAYDKLRQAELQRNTWRTAIRRVILRARTTSTMFVSPTLWSSGTTYLLNSIVSDSQGTLWISVTPSNLNNNPGYSTAWQPYFGSLTADVYDSTQSYYSGELVYVYSGDGTYSVYRSLIDSNTSAPNVGTAWSATATYNKDDIVKVSSTVYKSRINLNLNNAPASSAADWASGTTYANAATVTGSDGYVYSSTGNGNVGNDPTTDGGVHWTNTGVLTPWTSNFTGGDGGSDNWVLLSAALSTTQPAYPLNTGPLSQSSTKNVYRLPANYLRRAPQDPKAGSVTLFGSPTGLQYDDWEFEGDYLLSGDAGPIPFRFVADIVDVTEFGPMFCEGLALRIGLELCETITQSTAKLQAVASQYKLHMSEARIVNAIETGPEEAPEDDFISCRY